MVGVPVESSGHTVDALKWKCFVGATWAFSRCVHGGTLNTTVIELARLGRVLEALTASALNNNGFFHFFDFDPKAIDVCDVGKAGEILISAERETVKYSLVLTVVPLHVASDMALHFHVAGEAHIDECVADELTVFVDVAMIESSNDKRMTLSALFSEGVELNFIAVENFDDLLLGFHRIYGDFWCSAGMKLNPFVAVFGDVRSNQFLNVDGGGVIENVQLNWHNFGWFDSSNITSASRWRKRSRYR